MKKTLSIVAVIALVAILTVALVACMPSDPSKAQANLKDAGYKAALDKNLVPGTFKLAGYDLDAVVTGIKGEDTITIFYFADKDNATKAMNKVKEHTNFDEKEKDKDSDWVCKQSGKIIYVGTKAAVKAAQ